MSLRPQLEELVGRIRALPMEDTEAALLGSQSASFVEHAGRLPLGTSELLSCLQACEPLTRLGKRLAAVWRGGQPTLRLAPASLLLAALYPLHFYTQAAADRGLAIPSHIVQGSVRLVLESRELVSLPSQEDKLVVSQEGKLVFRLTDLAAKHEAMVLAGLLHNAAGAASMARVAPVPELMDWLERCTAQLCCLNTNEAGLPEAVECLASLVDSLHEWPGFAAHAAAFQRNIALQQSLLSVLMAALGKHATALRQPAGAPPAAGDEPASSTWTGIRNIAETAALHVGAPAWQRWFAAQPGVHSTTALATVVSLTCTAPLDVPTSSVTAELRVVGLLSRMCNILRVSPASILLGGESWWGQRHRHLAHQLLQAMPRLLQRLRLAASTAAPLGQSARAAAVPAAHQAVQPASHVVTAVMPVMVFCLYLLSPQADGVSGGVLLSLQQLPQWCRVASMALTSLPVMAQLSEMLPSMPAGGHASAVARSLLQLSMYIAAEASQLTMHASFHGQPLAATNPAAAAEAHAALWQLHSTACRLVHSPGLLQRLQAMQQEQAAGQLVGLLDTSLTAAIAVWVPLDAGKPMPQKVQPLSAAHCEALLALPYNTLAQDASNAIVTLWKALETAPVAYCVRTEQDPFALMTRLLEPARQQVHRGSLHDLLGEVLHCMRDSPYLAARLAAAGTLERIVSDLTAVCGTIPGPQRSDLEDDLQGIALLTVAAQEALIPNTSPQSSSVIDQRLSALLEALTDLTQAGPSSQLFRPGSAVSQTLHRSVLPAARQLGQALLEWWALPEQAGPLQLEVAQAAATRSCAYLRCANLAAEGGPAAGQGVGSMRCSACCAVWYCGTTCSHADWREGGHRRLCKALGAARQQAKQARRGGGDS